MSEVDGVSNSGLYPALPIADRRSSKDDKERRQRSDQIPPTRPARRDRPNHGSMNTPDDADERCANHAIGSRSISEGSAGHPR
jgi:hypothetical protein